MRKNLAFLALLLLYGCGGGGGGTASSGSATSSTGGGLTSNPGGSPPAPGGSTPVTPRVLELVNKLLTAPKVLEEDVRWAADPSLNAGYNPQISPDGRFVAFSSESSDIVAGDTNNATDIFVRDRANGITYRANYDPANPATHNGVTGGYFFSDDLNWLVFNIPTDPPTSSGHNFLLRNLQTGQTFTGQGFLGGLSADGRYVSYWRGPNPTHPYLFDRQNNQIIDLTPATNGDSNAWHFSPDGALVYFASEATNLVPNDTNGVRDLFSYRLSDGQISLVSVLPDGTQFNGPSGPGESSSDGRYYTFPSQASNVVVGDSNAEYDIFVKDTQTGQFRLVSRALSGAANGESQSPAISGDGKLIVFNSKASNLVEKDTNNISDTFLYNRETQTLLGRVSLNDKRKEAIGGDDRHRLTRISRDGQWITFTTEATNMIRGVPGGYCNSYVTNVVVPELYQPPGPHANAYELLLTGTANLDMSPFSVATPQYVVGAMGALASNATRIDLQVGIGSNTVRELQIHFNKPASQLVVGDQVEVPDPNGSEVYFNQLDRNLQIPSLPYRTGASGLMTITSLRPGPGTSGTVGIRLDDWEMVPDSRVMDNPATGSFRLNGTVTVDIP